MADKEWRLISDQQPEKDQWCWISDGEDVIPAIYYPVSWSNWSNSDTWHDFENEYHLWMPMDVPEPPRSTSPAES